MLKIGLVVVILGLVIGLFHSGLASVLILGGLALVVYRSIFKFKNYENEDRVAFILFIGMPISAFLSAVALSLEGVLQILAIIPWGILMFVVIPIAMKKWPYKVK